MSARRRARVPLWPRIAAVVAVGLLAVALVFGAARLLSGSLGMLRSDGGPVERDPQFAEPAETVTRPPELDEQGTAADAEEDPSASWDLGEQTPVDKTAEELSREAQAAP